MRSFHGWVTVAVVAFSFGGAACSGVKTAPVTGAGTVALTEVVPAAGPLAGNVPVELHGTGFVSQNLLVTFGGSAVSDAAVVNDTTIHGTLPPHSQPGAVDVSVACAGGQATLHGGFTYSAAASMSITGINPNQGPTAGGTTVVINGTGFNGGATNVAFGAINGTSVTVTDDTTLSVITPAAAADGAVSITISNNNGAASLPNSFMYGSGTQQGGTVTEHLGGVSEFDRITQMNNAPTVSGNAFFFAATDVSYPAPGTCILDLNQFPGVTATLDAGPQVTISQGATNTNLPKDTSSGYTQYSLQNGPVSNFTMGTMSGVSAPGAGGGVAAFNVAQVASAPAADFDGWLDPLGLQKFTGGGFWSGKSDLWLQWSDNGTAGSVTNQVDHVQILVIGADASSTTHVLQCDLRSGGDVGSFCVKGGGTSDLCLTGGATMNDFWTAIGGPVTGFGSATVALFRGNRSTYDIGGGNTAALDVNVARATSLIMSN